MPGNRGRGRAAWLVGGALSLALIALVQAGTFPSGNLNYQTSGRQRAATIGDWYTANSTSSADQVHRFIVEITPEQLAAAGGSITITVEDAESTAGTGPLDEVSNASDPVRFELRAQDGTTVLQGQTLASGTANGTSVNFTVTSAGTYQVVSMTGGEAISGDTTAGNNDDDNSFRITVPYSGGTTGGLLGVTQGSYQQDTGATTNVTLYFLVGPGSTFVNLRNFDLDGGGTITYTNPSGTVTNGTESDNGVWNGAGGTINAGQDQITGLSTTTGGAPDAGVWQFTIAGFTSNNQMIFEASNNFGQLLPVFDVQPLRGGFFTLSSTGTLSTTVGTPIDHTFSVANNFATGDIVNFTLSGTSANYTVSLRTSGGAALTDSDGDGNVDTGLLNPNTTTNFILRVTPNTGASGSDTTRISGTSFMDGKIGTSSNTTRYIDRTTVLAPSISKAFLPNPMAVNGTSVLTFTLSNINAVATTGAAFADTYPAGLVNAATPGVTNTCGGTVGGGAAGGNTIGLTGGTIPAYGACIVTVNVTSAAAGSYANTSGAISSTNQGTGNTANATLEVVNTAPPSVAKSFAASPIQSGGTTTLTLTLNNPNPSTTLAGVAVSDTYPANLVNATLANAATTCSGATLTGGANGGNTVGITGGSIPGNGSCTVSVNVTSTTNASYLNTTGAVSSTNGGTGNTSGATLVVHSRPTIAKAFGTSPVNIGGTSTLTITLTNPNSSVMTGASFTDAYPSGLVNTTPVNAGTTCAGGTVTASAGGGSVALSSGTIPANGSCTVTVDVTSASAGTYNNTITAGGLSTTNGITNAAAASASLVVQAISPPTVTKSFSISPIGNGAQSTLTIVVSNPNASTALSSVALTDTYPTNLVNANPASAALSCTAGSSGNLTGGANGGSTVGLSSATLLASGSCTITVKVTSTTNATYNNTTGAPTSANGGTGTAASASLTVQAGTLAPVITKSFSPDEVGTSSGTGNSVLTLTITNPNNATLNNVRVQDTYPTNLVNASTTGITNTCGGNTTAGGDIFGGTAGGSTFGLQGNNNDMAANLVCTVTINVRSATAGTYANTTGNVTTTSSGGLTGNTASATLTVARPTIAKSFGTDPMNSGGTSTLTVTIANPTDINYTTMSFTDTFPASPGAMTVASPLTSGNTCGGSLLDNAGGALAAGDAGIQLSAGTLLAHSSCTVTVNVTASASGTYTNTIAAGNLSTSGGTSAGAASDTLTVPARPTVAKSFAPTSILENGLSTLTITLSNNNTAAATGAAFTDTLPAGLITVGTPATNCANATLTSTATTVSMSGGTIPGGAPGTCTVTVGVTGSTPGSHVNTIAAGALSASTGTNAAAGSATLTVVASPDLAVAKSSTTVSDPVNNTTNPKSIPGAFKDYTLTVTNSGAGTVDNNTTYMVDAVPTNTELHVGDLAGAGSGPVQFTQGSPTSGLNYTFTSLASTTDDIEFSNDGGATFTYTPSANANGVDPSVTHFRVNPKGTFAATGGGNPSFTLRFRVRVK